jgi:hypothetical protein
MQIYWCNLCTLHMHKIWLIVSQNLKSYRRVRAWAETQPERKLDHARWPLHWISRNCRLHTIHHFSSTTKPKINFQSNTSYSGMLKRRINELYLDGQPLKSLSLGYLTLLHSFYPHIVKWFMSLLSRKVNRGKGVQRACEIMYKCVATVDLTYSKIYAKSIFCQRTANCSLPAAGLGPGVDGQHKFMW